MQPIARYTTCTSNVTRMRSREPQREAAAPGDRVASLLTRLTGSPQAEFGAAVAHLTAARRSGLDTLADRLADDMRAGATTPLCALRSLIDQID
jgi:hypothetical protein